MMNGGQTMMGRRTMNDEWWANDDGKINDEWAGNGKDDEGKAMMGR